MPGLMVPRGGAPDGRKETDWSGGRAVAHRAEARPVQSKRLASHAPRAVVYAVGHDAWEPTVGITKNGAIFYAAYAASNQIDVMRSTNEGKTWEVVSPKVGPANRHVTADPYVFVDEITSRVYTIDLYVACSILSYSDDEGETWITNPLACGRPVNDHQSLFSGPPVTSATVGYPNILYYCWNDVLTSSCSKSLDGGITFVPTGSPAFAPGAPGEGGAGEMCGGLHGHGVVGLDGTVYLPREYCGEPWLAMSTDEGMSWEHVQVANNGVAQDEDFGAASDPTVAVDRKGNIYYAWIASNRLPYLTVSRDAGKTWSKPLMIAAPKVREASMISLDAGDPGKIAFAYMGTENMRPPLGEKGDYARATWNGYIGITVDGLSKDPLFYSGHINDKRYPLTGHKCSPRRCTGVGDFLDIQIAPDGTPWATFVDACLVQCPPTQRPQGLGQTGLAGALIGGPRLR
jgi:hypothetical protein